MELQQKPIHLANKLAIKHNESYSTVKTWLRTRLSFEIVRSALLGVRDSRTPWRVKDAFETGEDFKLNTIEAGIF